VKFENTNLVERTDKETGKVETVVMNRHALIKIFDDSGRERERYNLTYGAVMRVVEGDRVSKGQILSEWDPYAIPLLTEVSGVVKYGDVIEGVTMEEKLDEVTGLSRRQIIESRDPQARPRVSVKDPKTNETIVRDNTPARYFLPVGSNIIPQEGQTVEAGEIIAKIPRETTKTKDITGGLPRVAELFGRANRRTTRSSPTSTAS
jgi:DNA-directed RNA polymerase subunit beta'